MAGKGRLRIGLAKRLKLEVPRMYKHRLQGPLSASVALDATGPRVRFYRDPESPYDWGPLDEDFGVYSLEIPAEDVLFDSPEAAELSWTFTLPVGEHWDPSGRRAWFSMPRTLEPPRPAQKVPSQRELALQAMAQIGRAQLAEVRAHIEQTTQPTPLWDPDHPSPLDAEPEYYVQAVPNQPVPVAGPLVSASTQQLVEEINRRIQGGWAALVPASKPGLVRLREVIE